MPRRLSGVARAGTMTGRPLDFQLRLPQSEIVSMSPVIDICPVDELPPGGCRRAEWEDLEIGVINCGGELLAIEDRCSHDDGDLLEGELDFADCTVECPRHGSGFRPRTRKPLNPPAHLPIQKVPAPGDRR